MRKIEVGDIVYLTTKNKVKREYVNWAERDHIQLNEALKVSRVNYSGWLRFDGHFLAHPPEKFTPYNCIVIVLRRKSDGRSMAKFLTDQGFSTRMGNVVQDTSSRSRVMVVHLHGKPEDKNLVTYNAQATWDSSVSEAIKSTDRFVKSFFNYKECLVVKTKPSINEAKNEIKKHIQS